MTPHIPLAARPWRLPSVWSTVAVALLVGCDEPVAITQYETPRVAPRAVAVDPEAVRKLLDHMFAAIVPAGKEAWFFKLVVPAPAAKDMSKPFDDFIATIEAKPGAALPAWTLPEGWTAAEGGNELRAATITIPHGDDKFEMTVSKLALEGKWANFLQSNVDRWMDQLGPPALDRKTIEKLARKLQTKGEDATTFELVGKMQASPMGMAGMPPGHAPLAGGSPPTGDDTKPAMTSPVPADDSPPDGDDAPVSAGKLVYDTPAGWQPGPLSVMGIPREAAFIIPADGGKAELSVTKFPATGAMAQLGPNVRRWAGQVGRVDLSEDDIRSAAQRIDISGDAALRFEFESPADAPEPQAIYAIMAVRGDDVWFIKLWGAKAALESQREAFDKFLASVRFP